MRYYLLILNIINILIFIWLLSIFNLIFDFGEVITTSQDQLVIFDVIDALRNVITYVIYYISYGIGFLSSLIVTSMFSPFPYFDNTYMFHFMDSFFKGILNNWFSFPGGIAPEMAAVPGLMGNELLVFTTDIYLLSFQLLFIISIIFALRAVLQNKPKYSLIVIGSLVLMIVIPLMIFGFRDMLLLFNLDVPYLDTLQNPIDVSLTRLPVDDFFAFFSSPVALMAIISYIYLEIAFQINYADIVTKPSLERKGRLEAQLNVLKRESQTIVADVDKIKAEAKAKMEELELEEKETIGGFFGKGAERFSYVKEMIRRKKLEEEEKKLVTAASKTRRLGRYLEQLFREDPEAEDTLTAKTSAPQPKSLVKSIITTFIFRVTLLIIISYIIIHPRWFLVHVFQVPPAMSESIVMYSPEVIIVLLGPLVILFPLISWIIQYIKHRNLIIRLKQEGRIKEILASVGDYVVIEKEEKKKDKEEEPEIIAEEAT